MVTWTRTVRSIALLTAALLLASVAEAQTRKKRPPTGSSRDRMMSRPGGLVGKEAPDFTLPLLVEEETDKGEKVNRITDKKVTLSDFRGKKVVCIFFSSYT